MIFSSELFQSLKLSHSKTKPRLSLYIPTHRKSQVQADKIRFKNALAEAEQKLCNPQLSPYESMNSSEARKFLREAYSYLKNDDFWLHLSDMLVLFISEDRFEILTLPIQRKALVHLGRNFYLSPLISLINKDRSFFILSLSLGGVALFEAGPYHITPIKIDDLIPSEINDLGDEAEEKSLQFHSLGGGQAIYHGQGMGKDFTEVKQEKYFRQLDEGLMKILYDEKLPMVLAGVDYLIPQFRSLSNYSHILSDHISGNQEHIHPADLQERAWEIASKFYKKSRQEKLEEFHEQNAKDKASFSTAEILKSAYEGKIKYLFLDNMREPLWGFYGYLTDNKVSTHQDQNAYNYCLYDYAAMKAFEKGAEIYFLNEGELPVPDKGMNAVYRY